MSTLCARKIVQLVLTWRSKMACNLTYSCLQIGLFATSTQCTRCGANDSCLPTHATSYKVQGTSSEKLASIKLEKGNVVTKQCYCTQARNLTGTTAFFWLNNMYCSSFETTLPILPHPHPHPKYLITALSILLPHTFLSSWPLNT